MVSNKVKILSNEQTKALLIIPCPLMSCFSFFFLSIKFYLHAPTFFPPSHPSLSLPVLTFDPFTFSGSELRRTSERQESGLGWTGQKCGGENIFRCIRYSSHCCQLTRPFSPVLHSPHCLLPLTLSSPALYIVNECDQEHAADRMRHIPSCR